MPRPDREQSILDAAGQVFARGYHGASMDEIAGLADVSKPMLYAYFGSKEGLYVAYVDRTGRELLDRLAGATTPDDQPSVRLRAGILEFLAFIEEHRDGWQVLFGELTSIGPVVEEVAVLRGRIADWITVDRKSTRLNSSHMSISYAVFCLKKKKKKKKIKRRKKKKKKQKKKKNIRKQKQNSRKSK